MADSEFNTKEYAFTDAELKDIQAHVAKYPDPKSAVMPVLWIAQNKYGWLSREAIQLVADTLHMPYAQVYGVASFYTMYFKKRVPKHVFDVCTCFACGECGGNEVYKKAKEYLKTDADGYSEDGYFFIRYAECLGACDTAPVMQVTNRHYVHKLTPESIVQVIDTLRNGGTLSYSRIPLNDQSRIDA